MPTPACYAGVLVFYWAGYINFSDKEDQIHSRQTLPIATAQMPNRADFSHLSFLKGLGVAAIA